jgi:ribosomal protein S18 acetylase RimI-like enzyme
MLIRDALQTDAAGIARVHVNSWRTTYRGIVPDQVLDSLSLERREQYWHDLLSDPKNQDINLVADVPPVGIAGFASAGKERTGEFPYQGELYAIYILKAYQGRGVGRQLVEAIVLRLQEQGLTSMMVWVLKDNLFRAFYEALGGQEVGEQDIKIGDSTLVEVAYGWKDIRSLTA